MTRFLNTVNLQEDEWQRLMGRLDVVANCKGGMISQQGNDRRDDSRLPFRRSGIPIVLRHKDKADKRAIVCTRNVSRGGVGLVHGSFVHPGTTAEVYLPLLDETWLRTTGTIVFCRHLTNKLHELGCRFNEPVPLEMIVDPDAVAHTDRSLTGDALQGRRVLIVTEPGNGCKAADQLREAGAEVYTASSIDEAVSKCREHSVELILLDFRAVRRDPGPAVARLRVERCRQMIAVFNVDRKVDPNGLAESWQVDIAFGEDINFEALVEGVVWILAHSQYMEPVH
jgi:hypothetical protein